MRIAIDATPALEQRGGVGRYTRELLRALVTEAQDHRFVLSAASNDAHINALLSDLPPGAWREIRKLPASERVMTGLWQRLRLPLDIGRWIGPHDLLHATDFTLPPTTAAKVVTIHDLSFFLCPEYCQPELAAYLWAAVPRSLDNADVVITVSASVAAEVAGLFPHVRSKLVAIPNGITQPTSAPTERRYDPPVVLMVGTIEPRKNHATILQAMHDVRSQVPAARLHVVGRRGWQDETIVAEIERGRREGWLDWSAEATDASLEAAYRNATVFVSASHYEGFGLPVLEAMARGVPTVVSDIAAHREVAGSAAQFAAASDADDFAHAIVELLVHEEARETYARTGICRAGEFSWQATARRTLRAYERAVAGGLR